MIREDQVKVGLLVEDGMGDRYHIRKPMKHGWVSVKPLAPVMRHGKVSVRKRTIRLSCLTVVEGA